jgi:hypothetical protein
VTAHRRRGSQHRHHWQSPRHDAEIPLTDSTRVKVPEAGRQDDDGASFHAEIDRTTPRPPPPQGLEFFSCRIVAQILDADDVRLWEAFRRAVRASLAIVRSHEESR